ncbi:hypothetical protein AgCh_004344 [Apium graveolens]
MDRNSESYRKNREIMEENQRLKEQARQLIEENQALATEIMQRLHSICSTPKKPAADSNSKNKNPN